MGRSEDIDIAIWGDPEFRALSADGKLLYVWSFTNPLCNMAGLYKLDEARMSFDTGLSETAAAKAFGELQAATYLVYRAPWLWVRTRVKYMRSPSPNMAKAIARDVAAVDPSMELRAMFLEAYEAVDWVAGALESVAGDTEPLADGPVTVPEGLGNPLATVPIGSVEPKAGTLPEPLPDPSQRVQGNGNGKGIGRRTTPAVAPDQLPDDLAPALAAVAPAVKVVLDRIFKAKGGTVEPTLAALGRTLAAYPKRNHLGDVEALEHWVVHGTGRGRKNKDIVSRYRQWLGNADEVTPPSTGPTSSSLDKRLAEAQA